MYVWGGGKNSSGGLCTMKTSSGSAYGFRSGGYVLKLKKVRISKTLKTESMRLRMCHKIFFNVLKKTYEKKLDENSWRPLYHRNPIFILYVVFHQRFDLSVFFPQDW